MLTQDHLVTIRERIRRYLSYRAKMEMAYPFEPRNFVVYILILTQLVCAIAVFHYFHFTTDVPFFGAALTWILIALAGILLRRIHFPRFGAGMEAGALLYGQGVVSIPLVIASGAFNAPWADSVINSWDLRLGFSWKDAIEILQPYQKVLEFAYNTFIWQGLVVISLLVLKNQLERLWIMVASATLTLLIVSVVFVWMPAQAAYAFYGFGPGEGPEAALSFLAPLTYIREGGRHLTMSTITGMVTFPSYHAASGVIFAWSCWKTPFRIPFVLLNIGLLIGTISVGGHYLSDVLAGILLASVTIIVCARLVRASAKFDRVALAHPTVITN